MEKRMIMLVVLAMMMVFTGCNGNTNVSVDTVDECDIKNPSEGDYVDTKYGRIVLCDGFTCAIKTLNDHSDSVSVPDFIPVYFTEMDQTIDLKVVYFTNDFFKNRKDIKTVHLNRYIKQFDHDELLDGNEELKIIVHSEKQKRLVERATMHDTQRVVVSE